MSWPIFEIRRQCSESSILHGTGTVVTRVNSWNLLQILSAQIHKPPSNPHSLHTFSGFAMKLCTIHSCSFGSFHDCLSLSSLGKGMGMLLGHGCFVFHKMLKAAPDMQFVGKVVIIRTTCRWYPGNESAPGIVRLHYLSDRPIQVGSWDLGQTRYRFLGFFQWNSEHLAGAASWAGALSVGWGFTGAAP